PRPTLLVDPDHAGFFQLSVLLPEFAGDGAKRSSLCLREIRSPPFSLGGGVTRPGEDALLLGHGRISCVSRMTLKLVDLGLTVDTIHTNVLRQCRGGGK